jgi:hypothetical protein
MQPSIQKGLTMSASPLRRNVITILASAPVLGLAACGGGGSGDDREDAAVELTPQEAVAASVADLGEGSYKMESNVTLNGFDFITFTEIHEDGRKQTWNDMLWSVIPEATGLTDEEAAYMGDFFTDSHTEAVMTEDTVYFQFANEHLDEIVAEYGEDAWFTVDLTAGTEFGETYAQSGAVDLNEQTDQVITSLTGVEETAPNVYTGTLDADSAIMQDLVGATAGAEAAVTDGSEVTVTLDENGLLQKMEMVLPETDGMAMTLISEVTETGADYDIKAPESTNLHDFNEFTSAMGGM